jgi:hypothetical protein
MKRLINNIFETRIRYEPGWENVGMFHKELRNEKQVQSENFINFYLF